MIIIFILVAIVVVWRFIRFLRSAILYRSTGFLLWHLGQLRLRKMDKEAVFIVSSQKCGSTHLCYICALINTEDAIRAFRNDFDILPILTFPRRWIAQNFNARQDGRYQMYKINGSLRFVYRPVMAVDGARRVIWTYRSFSGYYCSVYWWAREFYPRKARRIFYVYRLMGWRAFKVLTFKAMVEDHIEDLWFAYCRVQQAPEDFIALSYEHLVTEKGPTIDMLSRWLGIGLNEATVASIVRKTSKEAMLVGDRFDPLEFGDGGGLGKVNVGPHRHTLTPDEDRYYADAFARRFAGTGISTYADYLREVRAIYGSPYR